MKHACCNNSVFIRGCFDLYCTVDNQKAAVRGGFLELSASAVFRFPRVFKVSDDTPLLAALTACIVQPHVLAAMELETFVSAEVLHLRAAASASAPSALAAASASSTPPPVVLSAMFGSRLFDQRVLGLVAQGLAVAVGLSQRH